MVTDQKLEAYLATLEKSLREMPVSERADIITEIKSHVLDAMDRDPNQSLQSILSALGEPESVANRYLLEKGLRPGKPSKSPMIKWLTIGFLGTVGIVFLAFIILLFKFSPLIAVDEKTDHVVLLGGLIDIKGKEGKIRIGSTYIHEGKEQKEIEGSKLIKPKEFTSLKVPFKNGKFEIMSSIDHTLRWKCKYEGTGEAISNNEDDGKIQIHIENGIGLSMNEDAKSLKLNFDQPTGIKCQIEIPDGLSTELKGDNGKIEIIKPNFPLGIDVMNGKIEFEGDSKRKYKFDMKVVNGKIDHFESSTDKDAIPILFKLINGKISRSE